jgi:thiol-disulfide isomerase/thioredoxin
MKPQSCEIGRHGHMGGLHCKTRRNTYMLVGALVLTALATVGFMSMQASAADAQNPITLNTPAPELVGSQWINIPDHRPLRLADRKGKVTILHFWTLGCINCKHNLPAYNRWASQFANKDVAIIGIHTPETPGEANIANVRAAVRKDGITYPVLVDSDGKNWKRWNQQFWPTVYLIDKHGNLRYRWEGELEYDNQDGIRKMTMLVDTLLNEK